MYSWTRLDELKEKRLFRKLHIRLRLSRKSFEKKIKVDTAKDLGDLGLIKDLRSDLDPASIKKLQTWLSVILPWSMLPLKRFKIHPQKKRLTNLDFLPVLTLLDYSVENQRMCNVLVYIVVLFVVITIVVWMVCMVMLPNCLDSCAYLWITYSWQNPLWHSLICCRI